MGASVSGLQVQPLEDVVALAQGDPDNTSAPMNEVVRRFEPRAAAIAASLTDDGAVRPDLHQEALVGLMRAVRRHQAGRPGFLTYAVKFMTGRARRELRKWKKSATVSLSQPAVWQAACAVAAPVTEVGQVSWGYGRGANAVATLPERQRELLTERYVDDKQLGDIAMACGTSVPAVHQRLATAHKAIATALTA
jgi:RNA polymerase sigma factor (sigma-70 family)